jgi:hypothetical protein
MIEILNFKLLNKGSLICTFTAKMHKMGGMLIRECTLFEVGDRRWVNLPSRTYEIEGKKKYFSFVTFEDRTMDDKFKELILRAVTEFMKNQKIEPVSREKEFEDIGELPF